MVKIKIKYKGEVVAEIYTNDSKIIAGDYDIEVCECQTIKVGAEGTE